jgi:hypothetical protein
MLTTEQRRARARLANATARANRSGADPERRAAIVDNARREYRYISASEYVRAVVNAAPPFTPEMVERLIALLRGGEPHGTA